MTKHIASEVRQIQKSKTKKYSSRNSTKSVQVRIFRMILPN